ncbi:CocE/NonD family hydrolase [Bifidobacterium simiarum]
MYFMGTQAGRDVHDTIEYIARQDWCTGKVCMMGNSQLAMI